MGPKVPMIALQSGGENKNSLCIRAFRRFINHDIIEKIRGQLRVNCSELMSYLHCVAGGEEGGPQQVWN